MSAAKKTSLPARKATPKTATADFAKALYGGLSAKPPVSHHKTKQQPVASKQASAKATQLKAKK